MPSEHAPVMGSILAGDVPLRRRLNPLTCVPRPAMVGAAIGWVIVTIWYELEAKWVFYLCAAGLALAALPLIATFLRGRLERFFLGLFLFSLQFYLSFNLVVADRPMPGGVMGLNVTLQLLLAVAYFAAWHTRSTVDPSDVRTLHRPFVTACAIFLGVASLSLLTTTTKSYTIYGIFYHFGLIVVALAACHICSSRTGLRALWKGIWAITITQCTVLLVQRVTKINFSMTGEIVDKFWADRYGGTMGIAPVSVATLLMGLVLFSELRLLRGDKRAFFVWGPAFGLSFLCLLLSLTRSAWIGCGIGSVFLIGWLLRRRKLSPHRGMALAAAAFVGLIVAYGPVRDRLDANHQAAADERWRLNYINLEMIKAHPILGIGLNTAYDAKRSYIPDFFTDSDWIYIAHNQYLLIAAEAGLLGLAAFLRILWIALKSAGASARSPDQTISEAGAVLFAYLLGFVWGMNLDFYGGMQVYLLLWFIFGCAAGVHVLLQRETAVRTEAAVKMNGGSQA